MMSEQTLWEIEMHKEIADKWVAALRSGEYKQRQRRLSNEERTEHCCLGVLCELAIKDGVEMKLTTVWSDEGEASEPYLMFNGNGGSPPDVVLDWAEMDKMMLDAFMDKNDLDGCSFGEIADFIEERWADV